MSRLVRFRTVIPMLLVLALAAVLATSALAAPKPKTQSGFLTISAGAFVPREIGFSYANNGSELVVVSDSEGKFVAPVVLPDGAEITKATAYYINTDRDASAPIAVFLDAAPGNSLGGGVNLARMLAPAGAETAVKNVESVVTAPERFIDNDSYIYSLLAHIRPSATSSIVLKKVRIDYNLP